MHTLEAIQTRRSVKQYDPAHRMTDAEVHQLLDLAMQSPTAFNVQHWRFVVVRDAGLRQKIRAVSWDQAQVTDASILIIVCADTQAWNKDAQRYWRNAPSAVQSRLVPAIDGYYRGKPQIQRDEAMRSCGIAAQTLMLAAKAMGYDSCPMDGFDFDAVAKLIHLPEDHLISMFVAVGKGTQAPFAKPGQLAYNDAVFENTF